MPVQVVDTKATRPFPSSAAARLRSSYMPECFSYAKVVGGIPSVLYAVVFIYAEVVIFVVKGLYSMLYAEEVAWCVP